MKTRVSISVCFLGLFFMDGPTVWAHGGHGPGALARTRAEANFLSSPPQQVSDLAARTDSAHLISIESDRLSGVPGDDCACCENGAGRPMASLPSTLVMRGRDFNSKDRDVPANHDFERLRPLLRASAHRGPGWLTPQRFTLALHLTFRRLLI